MRESVRQPLPVPGFSSVALLDWQILQSKGLLEKAQSHRAHQAKAGWQGASQGPQGHTCG